MGCFLVLCGSVCLVFGVMVLAPMFFSPDQSADIATKSGVLVFGVAALLLGASLLAKARKIRSAPDKDESQTDTSSDESWIIDFAVSYDGFTQSKWPDYIDKVRNAGFQAGAVWIEVDHRTDVQDRASFLMRFRAKCYSKEKAQAALQALLQAGACEGRVVGRGQL